MGKQKDKALQIKLDNLQTQIYKAEDKINVLASALGVYISEGPAVQGQIQIPPPSVTYADPISKL